MKILVTGGLGWLGKAITEVVSQHHEVCAFDLETPDVERERIKFNGEKLFGSVTDFGQVQDAVKGKDAIIHAAVASTVTRNQYADVSDAMPFEVNIRGTCNILEAARREVAEDHAHEEGAGFQVETHAAVFEHHHLDQPGEEHVDP